MLAQSRGSLLGTQNDPSAQPMGGSWPALRQSFKHSSRAMPKLSVDTDSNLGSVANDVSFRALNIAVSNEASGSAPGSIVQADVCCLWSQSRCYFRSLSRIGVSRCMHQRKAHRKSDIISKCERYVPGCTLVGPRWPYLIVDHTEGTPTCVCVLAIVAMRDLLAIRLFQSLLIAFRTLHDAIAVGSPALPIIHPLSQFSIPPRHLFFSNIIRFLLTPSSLNTSRVPAVFMTLRTL
jgi:hypothetical protein